MKKVTSYNLSKTNTKKIESKAKADGRKNSDWLDRFLTEKLDDEEGFSLHPDNHAYIEAVVLKQKETNHRYNRSMYMDDLITHLRTKAEVKPSPKSKVELAPVELTYPMYLNITAWNKWIEFRKVAKFKKYKSDATMKKLAKMGDANEQKLIVQQSIDNEYQGLFALKGNNNGHQSTGKKESSHERIKRENAVKYGGQDESGLRVAGTVGHMGGAVDSGEGIRTIEQVDIEPFIDY